MTGHLIVHASYGQAAIMALLAYWIVCRTAEAVGYLTARRPR